jgi:hypothetical protein
MQISHKQTQKLQHNHTQTAEKLQSQQLILMRLRQLQQMMFLNQDHQLMYTLLMQE